VQGLLDKVKKEKDELVEEVKANEDDIDGLMK